MGRSLFEIFGPEQSQNPILVRAFIDVLQILHTDAFLFRCSRELYTQKALKMSASKFLHFGTSLFLRTPTPPSRLLFPKSLRFLRFSSSAAVDPLTDGTTVTTSSPHHQPHPWPEWITFVDRLKTKGYFVELPPEAKQEAGSDVGPGDAKSLYIDMNLVKDACLSFARDRYDVFK